MGSYFIAMLVAVVVTRIQFWRIALPSPAAIRQSPLPISHRVRMMLRDGSYGLIADELERLSEELTEAGEELSTDVALLVKHRRLLQSFDQWVQIQRGLAQLLRADDIGRAIASCRPGDLAARLKREAAQPHARPARAPR